MQSNPVFTRAVVVLTLIAMVGCASFFDRVSHSQMSPRLAYQGFSFDRPTNPSWYLLRSQESHTDVTLRRDLNDPNETHTFYANVSLGSIERQPANHEEFAELARSKGQTAPYGVETVAYAQRLVNKQGQWCIRFESDHLVRGAPNAQGGELRLIVRGYRCLHPAWPRVTLDFFYSERGISGEIDTRLWEEGERFLDGVRIDVAPDTPAA